MTNDTKEKIIDYIKDKESFSIPEVQSALDMDYGTVREAFTELEIDKNIEFLEGIVYKFLGISKENDDRPSRPGERRRVISDWSSFFDNDDKKDEKDESDTSWESLFSNSSDDDKDEEKDDSKKSSIDWDSIFSSDSKDDDDDDDDDDIFGVDPAFSKFFASSPYNDRNGGPIPEPRDNKVDLSYFKLIQNKIEDKENTFTPSINVLMPRTDKKLEIHIEEDDDGDSYFHDGDQIKEYIRSLAAGLDSDTVNKWCEIASGYIFVKPLYGVYVNGKYLLSVPKKALESKYHRKVHEFVSDIDMITRHINKVVHQRKKYEIESFDSELRSKYADLAEKVLESDIGFESVLEFIEKVVELEPNAHAGTITHLLLRCGIISIRKQNPNKQKIIDFCSKARKEHSAAINIYFMMKKAAEIEEG